MSEKEEKNYKIIIIGDSGVGKTKIFIQYLHNEFEMSTEATVGVDLGMKTIDIHGNSVKLQIWDTAGHERFKAVTYKLFKGAQGAFVVYDITKKESFDNVDKWINDLKEFCRVDICILLIGNKNDLDNKRQVSVEEGENKSKFFNIGFFETSALTNSNIEKAFEFLANELLKKQKDLYDEDKGNTISIKGEGKEIETKNENERNNDKCMCNST